MQKLEVYPTKVENFDIQHEEAIFKYLNLIDEVQKEESVIAPIEFYTVEMMAFIYDDANEKMQSIRDYLCEVVLKLNKNDIKYKEIFDSLNKESPNVFRAIMGMYENKYIQNNDLYIDRFEKVYLAKKFYLSLRDNYHDFELLAREIFTNLIFLDKSFDSVALMGSSLDVKEEIIRHFDILNRFAHAIYIEEKRDAGKTMSKLRSSYDIKCTGIGSKEEAKEYRISDTYKGKSVNVRCNAHTKLFDGRNNYRIYFSWENIQVESDKIIIVSVGGHIV